MLNGGTGVPETIGFAGDFLEQRDVVVPGDLCKRCLHNCSIRPSGAEGAAQPRVLLVGVQYA
jgi:hypothetical protein